MEHKKNSIDLKSRIESITSKDRKDLEVFFEILMKHSEFGFTLFGKKPASFVIYENFENRKTEDINDKWIYSILLEHGWKVWEKYSHLFPSKNFVLLNETDTKRQAFVITILNKAESLNVVKMNIESFKEEYGQNFSPEKYIHQFSGLNDLKHSLLGILLGYGKKNAHAFQRNNDIALYYVNDKKAFDRDFSNLSSNSLATISSYAAFEGDHVSDLHPSAEDFSLAEEFNELRRNHSFFDLESTDYGLTSFNVPVFAVLDKNEETEELKKSYLQTLQVLVEKYKNNNFLETTLEQWVNQ